jgi:hypothetical protein
LVAVEDVVEDEDEDEGDTFAINKMIANFNIAIALLLK